MVYPQAATADAQIKVLDNLISQDLDPICISANDVNALQARLWEEAMDEGDQGIILRLRTERRQPSGIT